MAVKYQFLTYLTDSELSGLNQSCKVRVKISIDAQEAKAAAPLSPILGGLGVSAVDFCKVFNDKTRNFFMGTPLVLFLYVKWGREFSFIVLKPILSSLIVRFIAEETVGGFRIIDLLDMYIFLVIYCHISGTSLLSNVKSLAGVLRCCKIKYII